MKKTRTRIPRPALNRFGSAVAFFVAICAWPLSSALAQNAFVQKNLVSDTPGLAAVTDTNLINPWGIAFSATGPFWVGDNGTGLSTLYTGTGAIQSTVVTIPPPAGQSGPAAPTGVVTNTDPGFFGTGTAAAHFIFSTEDGTISAWSSGSTAVLKVDYSTSNSVFKGLATGVSGGTNFIYATDFHNGLIYAFDSNYTQIPLIGSFHDASIPTGYAPFGIQNIGGRLFVTYALQDAEQHDDVAGPGHGYVSIFDTSGNLLENFAAQSVLNSPWGLTSAPPGYGPFAGDILVGNFGDGRINAFDPASGEWLGSLSLTNGRAFAEIGLWAIAFGNGHSGGTNGTLYFTAGLNGESDGLLGSLAPVYPSPTNGITYVQSNLVSDMEGLAAVTDTNLVNPWGIALSAGSPFWIGDNGTGLSTLYNGSGAIQSTVVTIPPPTGQVGPAAPTGVVTNSDPGFFATGTSAAHFIFATEDGTISAWSSGANAVLKVDYSTSNSVFKGLATGNSGGTNFLYATDFHNGQVDVFKSNYTQVTLEGTFSDPTIPAGYAPFGIQNIAGQIFVSYALQDAEQHDDVGGPGHGFVNVFDTSGNLLRRFASQSVLNSPWGMVLAPVGFGAYGGNVLIGNFGDGRINVFNPGTGAWVGAVLNNTNGGPFEVPGLWDIIFGNGKSGGGLYTLYFAAGINGESDGLLGSIVPVYPAFTSLSAVGTNVTLNWAGGSGTFTVQESTNLGPAASWVTLTTTTTNTASVTSTNQNGYFRLLDTGN